MSSVFGNSPIPPSVIDGFYSDREKRQRILSQISYGPERDRFMRQVSPSTRMLGRNHAIHHADRVYFEAMQAEVAAQREAAAVAAETFGHHDLAAIIRGQRLPEWRE